MINNKSLITNHSEQRFLQGKKIVPMSFYRNNPMHVHSGRIISNRSYSHESVLRIAQPIYYIFLNSSLISYFSRYISNYKMGLSTRKMKFQKQLKLGDGRNLPRTWESSLHPR